MGVMLALRTTSLYVEQRYSYCFLFTGYQELLLVVLLFILCYHFDNELKLDHYL
jgi:hypothetical protein